MTCSLVVLPLATNTMWNPVNPQMGRKTKDMMHMITMVTMVVTWNMFNKNL